MTLEDILHEPPAQLDALPVDLLASLQAQAQSHLAKASQFIAILHGVFTIA